MTPPLIFAHRGAPRVRSEQNTLEAFQRGLAGGATGLESDIGLTADGIPVLTHTGLAVRRSATISRTLSADLPPQIPTLAGLYATCGMDFDLSLDMAHPQAVDAVVETATRFGAVDRLWLTYWRVPTLRAWRQRWPAVKLVYPTIPLRRAKTPGLLARLHGEGVDVLNVYHLLCHASMVNEAHQLGVRVFVWGIRSRGSFERSVRLGVDGAYCDNLDAVLPDGSIDGI